MLITTLIFGVVVGFFIGRWIGGAEAAYNIKHGMLEDITESLGIEAATEFVKYSLIKRGV